MTSEPTVDLTAATGAGPDGGAPGRRARLLSLLRLGQGGAGRHVATLSLGTGLVMAIQFGGAWALGHLIDPNDMGVYGNLVSVATIVALAATLGLERAISLADTEEEAADLTRVALATSLLAGLLSIPVAVWVAVSFFGDHGDKLATVLTAPVLIWLSATFSVFRAYLPRLEKFRDVSNSNVTGTALMTALQIGLAALRVPGGLGLGYLSGRALSSVLMLRASGLRLTRRVRWALVGKWKQFPQWVVVPAVLNAATVGGVTPLITSLYGDTFAGHFRWSQQLLAVPVGLLGAAVASVFYVRFARMDREGADAARPMVQLASILLAIGVAVFVPVTLLAREVFDLVWAEGKWTTAGVMTGLMGPYLLMQFASSPLSGYATVKNRVKRNFVLAFVEAGLRVPALAIGVLAGEPMWGIQAYCWAGLAITLYWVVWVMRLSGAARATAWRVVALPLVASTAAWALTSYGRGPLGETAYVLVSLVLSAAALGWGGLATLKALRAR